MRFIMRNFDKTNKMAICCTLLFLVELVVIFRDFVPVSTLKVVVYMLCFVLFLGITRHSGVLRCNKTKSFWILTWLYLVMMFLRLCFDFLFPWKGFFIYLSPLTILFFYFMTMLMPCYFIRRVDVELDYKSFALIAGVCLCFYLFYSYNEIISGVVETATTGGQYAGVGGIDIITYGHLGLSLVLIAVYILMYLDKKFSLLSILFFVIGFSAMILSGSRSPFVGLVLCLIILLRSRYSKWYYAIIWIGVVIISFNYFKAEIVGLNGYLESIGISSFGRVVNTFIGDGFSIDEVSSGRDEIWNIGWNMFLQNPILGVSYLLPDDSYVHNIFIEQFMALGIIGGAIFVVINMKTILFGWKMIKASPKMVLVYALFIQYLILGCFSRTIIALGAYWLFMFITIRNYERIEQNTYSFSNNPYI